MSSIFLTGATGFIGSALIRELSSAKYHLNCLVRNKTLPASEKIELIQGDLSRPFNFEEQLKKSESVVHLAGLAHVLYQLTPKEEADFFKINTEATVTLARQALAAGVKHFIFVSSVKAVVEESEQCINEQTPCTPISAYGRSKRAAEEGLIALFKSKATKLTILRPVLVYGPRNVGNMQLLVKLVRSGVPIPFGAIKNRRSFLGVENLASAIRIAIEKPEAAQGIFMLSDGTDLSTPELIATIAEAIKLPNRTFALPVGALRAMGQIGSALGTMLHRRLPFDSHAIDRLTESLFVDSRAFQSATGWIPAFSLSAGFTTSLIITSDS